jgi:hypothetical protein
MTLRYEPTISELMADPLVRSMMSADRVDPHALEAMLYSLAPRFAGRRRSALAHRRQPPSDARAAAPTVSPGQAAPMAKTPRDICGSICSW